jgi:hypothetical protein
VIGLVDEAEPVSTDAVGRCSWDVDEARRDVAALAWIGRFRFVTPEALAERLGVSWQRANARVWRLERLGLVGCSREHVSQPRAVFVTGRGFELLGQPRRRLRGRGSSASMRRRSSGSLCSWSGRRALSCGC